ncbi:MAG: spoIIIJ-associated protein [Candidatus Binatia bacterium]|jgi:spoIIIJ-associated protein
MSNQAKTTLEEIIKLLHFDDVKVEERQLDDGVLLELETEDSGRLIGRQGKTLSQLQYLVNRIVFQKDRSAPKITVDVGNYRTQAHEALVNKAQDAAEKVRRWGDIVELEPMNAFERRIIHNALKDDETVETHSIEVEGMSNKAILLRPKQ